MALVAAFILTIILIARDLSKTYPVESHVIVLESWGLPLVIEGMVRKQLLGARSSLFVVGKKYVVSNTRKKKERFSYEFNANESQLKIYEPANLILRDSFMIKHRLTDTVSLLASGVPAFNIDPLISIHINDTVIWKWIPDVPLLVRVPVAEPLTYFNLCFVNDVGYKKGDRMIFLRNVCFDTSCYQVTDTTFHIVAGVNRSETFYQVFGSDGELASLYLQQLGIPSGNINVIGFTPNGRNLTLQSARACKQKLQSCFPELTSFNIITADMHSRRSHFVYKKVFGESYNVGVIPIEFDNLNQGTKRWKGLKMKLEESINLIISWLMPGWFYQ